jgi:hypothetical protein
LVGRFSLSLINHLATGGCDDQAKPTILTIDPPDRHAVLCPDKAHEFSVNQRLTDFRQAAAPHIRRRGRYPILALYCT